MAMASRYFVVNNKNFRNSLQVLSLAIICCTLIIYQVTSAVTDKNVLYSESANSDSFKLIGDETNTNSISDNNINNNNGDGGPTEEQQIRVNKGSFLLSPTVRKDTISSKIVNSNIDNDNSIFKRAVYDDSSSAINRGGKSQEVYETNQIGSNNEYNNYDGPVSQRGDPVTTFSNINLSGSAKERLLVDNVFLSVKSTKRFHQTRLKPVLKTWFNLAKDQTWIFTDGNDPELEHQTNGHIINTHCPATHYRQALCCKMSMEFEAYLRTSKSWFCHFDDDNYVNVPALLELLGKYNHRKEWYLGKPSLKGPIHIPDPNNRTEDVSFWFATGGAGFCISRALALRMSPLASGGKFIKQCDQIQLPDDVTVGYIVGHLLGQNLTVIPQFHSHFETMKFIDMKKNPHSEITFSYVRYDSYENILDVKGFTEEEDPTRFLSLHCLLYPNFSYCINR